MYSVYRKNSLLKTKAKKKDADLVWWTVEVRMWYETWEKAQIPCLTNSK